MPTLAIDASIRAACPSTALGCISYAVRVAPENPDLWAYYERETAPRLREQLSGTELAAMPQIGASRAAYKAFGLDPGRQRVSSEALYRRVRQGKALYRINTLVDANNLISLETGFSLGSYDTARVGPDMVFRLGRAGEVYAGIGKADIPLEHMPLLADARGPFGSPTSDSTRGMITPDTRAGLTVIYAFSGRAELDAALTLAEDTLRRFAGITDARVFTL